MKATYRTMQGEYGVMEYPIIAVEEKDNQFVLTAYRSDSDIDINGPIAGIMYLSQFELFQDED